ncbi:hypothetical protein NMY22_g12326 [Coprinellus aureogranulatus]|nr:hypothetical protein NMY22_g12326 [Coprinellus aureogranulatus]
MTVELEAAEDFTIVAGEASAQAPAELGEQKDETYYWTNNVTFSVENVLFRVSPYPFVLGSEHFVQKYDLLADKDECGAERVINLDGVTAAQFRVLLKFLFPVNLTSTTSTYTKEEWLTILTLAIRWHFREARRLAIQHLDKQLTDLELILIGRQAYVLGWLFRGYMSFIQRPANKVITEDESEAIGHREVNRLWAIRYRYTVGLLNGQTVELELRSRFSKELQDLHALGSEHRTKVEVKEEERQRQIAERELRDREELERERARIEEDEERRRLEDEAAQREWFEEEERKRIEEEECNEILRSEEEMRRKAEFDEQEAARRASQGKQRMPRSEPAPGTSKACAGLRIEKWHLADPADEEEILRQEVERRVANEIKAEREARWAETDRWLLEDKQKKREKFERQVREERDNMGRQGRASKREAAALVSLFEVSRNTHGKGQS